MCTASSCIFLVGRNRPHTTPRVLSNRLIIIYSVLNSLLDHFPSSSKSPSPSSYMVPDSVLFRSVPPVSWLSCVKSYRPSAVLLRSVSTRSLGRSPVPASGNRLSSPSHLAGDYRHSVTSQRTSPLETNLNVPNVPNETDETPLLWTLPLGKSLKGHQIHFLLHQTHSYYVTCSHWVYLRPYRSTTRDVRNHDSTYTYNTLSLLSSYRGFKDQTS